MDPAAALANPQYSEILKTLEKFGFKFFGYAENKEPLVVAPNGQVTSLTVAYNFVKSKLIEPSKTGGVEAMPQMPVMPESSAETSVEKAAESEKSAEKASQNAQPSDLTVKRVAPKVASVAPKVELPFGDGFYPKVFDPTDVSKAQSFVSQNSQKDDKTAEKWLAVLWDKFLKELSENN